MTLQVERPGQAPGRDPALLGGHSRRQTIALVAALVVTMAGATLAAVEWTGHPSPSRHRAVVLGAAREPLAVHRVITRAPASAAADGQRLVPLLTQPGRQVLVESHPAVSLHVRYAHVRPVGGNWQVEMVAAEGTEFTMDAARGRSYDVVIHGRALTLFFVSGNPDGATFAIGGGASLTESEAVALAKSLTTQVSVARCTAAAIAANMCA
jgi:hypothetical protein